MPEGGEVKIIGENLASMVSGKVLRSITPINGRYVKSAIPGIEHFSPSKVVGVGVKGKLIFWILDCNAFLINTLGMTGSWSGRERKHARVKFEFEDGSVAYFEDARNFGTLKFLENKNLLIKKLNSLGPDMLSGNVSPEDFSTCISKKPAITICQAMLDQSLVCGIGNYVRAEALYRSKVNPHRLVGSLSTEELHSLCKTSADVLQEAYKRYGASFRNYRKPDGERGEAADFFEAYGRKFDPHGNKVIREDDGAGRAIHWVPAVQH